MYTIEQEGFISFLRQKEQDLLEKQCGIKYSRTNSAWKRVKTVAKYIYTRFGKLRYTFVYVKDVAGRIFSPLLEHLGIGKYQHMSKDLKNRLRDKASKMTYADAVEDIANSFGFQITRQALWRINQETEKPVFTKPDKSHCILLADGTKIRSNKGKHHEPRVAIAIKPGSKEKSMVCFKTAKSWEKIAESIDFTNFRVLVADGEPGLRHNLCKEHMWFHFCSQHAETDLGFYLWKDGLAKIARNEFMKPFKVMLYTVKGSTKKYFKDHDKARLLTRIAWANKQIDIIAARIKERDLPLACEFLERNKKYLFTAAIVAVKYDLEVPWTTNQAERLMKELGKRTKKKSMRWSVNGLTAILQAVLKRYFLPPKERNYKNIFGGDNITGG